MRIVDIRVGDVIDCPLGIHNTVERITIHDLHVYEDGSASIRFRYASNPRGIDWHGFVEADDEVTLVARGVARVDGLIRSLLPG